MAMKSDVVEELRIDDSEFERVDHIFPGGSRPGDPAFCGSRRVTGFKGLARDGVDPETCVVCVELWRASGAS